MKNKTTAASVAAEMNVALKKLVSTKTESISRQ